MPLNSLADCQDKAKVWDELHDTYDKKRYWTKNELKFMAPTPQAIAAINPPYTVRMVSGDAGIANSEGEEGTWRYVEIVSTKGGGGNVRVGKVRDH
jgi:hypothetical protein